MKAVRPPEPEVIEAPQEELLSDEPLLGENDVVIKKPAPIDNDPALISEDSLYSDEDPLDVLSKKKKAAQQAAAKAPPPAKPASKVMPLSAKPGSGLKPGVKGSNSKLAARKAEPEEPQEIEEVDVPEEISADVENVPEVEEIADDVDVKAVTVKKTLPAGSRGKSTARLSPSSSRGSRGSRKELEDETRNSRRTTKRSTRGEAPKFAISKKQLIIAGVAAVLGLVLLVGWKPFWKSQHMKKLDSAEASVADKSAAVKALFDNYHGEAFEIFSTRLSSSDAGTREAAIGGMELFAKNRQRGSDPFTKISETFGTADAPGKILLIKSAQTAIKALDSGATAELDKEDFDKKKIVATMLIAGSDPKEPAGDVRLAAIDALGSLRVPGVCKQLLTIAMTEKGDVRAKAKAGVDYTALPDVAPDLLQIMIGNDEEMKKLAQDVFKNVQKGAKSAALLPHVKNPSPEVREKIVAALGERKNDPVAAEAMTMALSDEVVKIRLLAVKSIPNTGVTKASVLSAPMNDADETVRVATAQTLGALRSLDCKRVVLEAFQNNPTGATMQALTAALAQCSSGKDIEAVGVILPFLKRTPPEGQAAMCEAMYQLTLRKADRKAWDGAQWEKWYAHISKRERMRKDALISLEDAKKGKDIKNSANFPALMKQTDDALAVLEECEKMCSTFNDTEDIQGYEKLRKDYSDMRYHFQKFQTLKH